MNQFASRELLRLVDNVPGVKSLVIDPTIIESLSLLIDYSLLQQHGVDKIYHLSSYTPLNHTAIFICRPQNLHMASKLFSSSSYLFLVPRKTLISDLILTGQLAEPILNISNVFEFHLDAIALDSNLYSLELDCFASLFVKNDTFVLHSLVDALQKFQIMHGFVPNIIAKGYHSSFILPLLKSPTDIINSDFATILLLDRTVDLITPLLSNYTYAGLIDTLFNIKSSSFF